jgi:hypothetical protein
LHFVIISILIHLFFPGSLWAMGFSMAAFLLSITWWITTTSNMK